MIEKKYTTTLETLAHDVGSILDHKLSATSPEAVADYVAFAVDNLTQNIERAKQAKKDLDAYIKEQTNAIETVKEGTSKWLSDNGIDKLEGMRVSSLTTYTPAPTQKLVIHNRGYFMDNPEFTKITLDETAIKNFISGEIDYSEFAEIETIHKQDVIKINKRTKKD